MNPTKKIWILQGSQGAAKTFSLLMLLVDAGQRKKLDMYVASAELAKMKITVVKDFLNIMNALGGASRYGVWNKSEHIFTFHSTGATIKFLGLDKDDIGKGLRSDIVFVNEANKIKFETYRQLTSRAKRIILDYNPDSHFWAHTEIIAKRTDYDYIQLTFEGNEELSKEERDEILLYKELGYNPDGTIRSEYWANIWRVYGLGEVGSKEGRVYTGWKRMTYEAFRKLPFPRAFAIDWGVNHPFAIIEGKYDRDLNTLYLHEWNYKSERQLQADLDGAYLAKVNSDSGGVIPFTMQRLSIPYDVDIVCDSARPDNIRLIREHGWENAYGIAKPAGSLITSVSLLQGTIVYYTDTSEGIDNEQRDYSFAKDRQGILHDELVDDNNHALDASRYLRMHFERNY